MTDHVACAWQTVWASVRGASHKRSGAPNQDAFVGKTYLPAANGLRYVMAVSDGHGSSKCIRSEVGSRLAVEIAVDCVGHYFAGSETVDKRRFESDFPSNLVVTWREAVSRHCRENPLTEEEYEKLNAGAGAKATEALREATAKGDGAALHMAYGATILMAVVSDNGIFYAQLGDGDILAVSAAGEVESPIPDDPSLMANETTSLCQRNAARQFRFGFHHIEKEPPALILLSTDGYANAFASPQDFRQVGTDVLRMIQETGMPTETEIVPWLEAASRQGSGDDVTLGILCRSDLVGLRKPSPDLPEIETPGPLGLNASSAPVGKEGEFCGSSVKKRIGWDIFSKFFNKLRIGR